MRRLFFTFVQFVLFFVTFAAGSFVPPFHLRHVLSVGKDGTHVFLWDGVVLMAVLFAVILLIEAAPRRIRTAAPWTVLALVLALAAGLALRLGFMTI